MSILKCLCGRAEAYPSTARSQITLVFDSGSGVHPKFTILLSVPGVQVSVGSNLSSNFFLFLIVDCATLLTPHI